MARIVITLISRDRVGFLQQTVEALKASDLTDAVMVAVDNGSTDGSAEYLHECGLFEHIYENPADTPQWQKNYAIIQGFKYAEEHHPDFEYFGWIDDDIVVQPSWLRAGITILKKFPTVAVASLHNDGMQERAHPTSKIVKVDDFEVRLKHSANGAVWVFRRDFFDKWGYPPVDGKPVTKCEKDDRVYIRRLRGKKDGLFGVVELSKHIGYRRSRRGIEFYSYRNKMHSRSYVRYFRSVRNWGDMLTPYIFEKLSGTTPISLKNKQPSHGGAPVYQITGSILSWCCKNTVVWGNGHIEGNAGKILPPRAIHAVRGPLSRQLLLAQGIPCPEVYGDPALIMPVLYHPDIKPTHEIGIVAHYVDVKHGWLSQFRKDPKIRFINVLSDIEPFIDALLSCKLIISSSLHGLVAADAYGIPSIHAQLTNKIRGGDFKYKDYYQSIGHEHEVVRIGPSTTLDTVIKAAKKHPIQLDIAQLLDCCPFNHLSVKAEG